MRGQFKTSAGGRTRASITTLPVVGTGAATEHKEDVFGNWSDAQDWFLANARRAGQKPGSIETRRQRFANFAEWCEKKGLRPGTVSGKDFKEYVDYCLDSKLSKFTINGRIRVLRTFFNEGIAEGLFTSNPATSVKKLKEPTNAVIPLTEEEVQALLSVFNLRDWVELRDYVITVVMLDTGTRITECLNAKIDHLNLKEGALWIPPEHGKGGKGRTVYFGQAAGLLIRDWLAKRGTETDWVFPSVYLDLTGNYHPLHRRAFWKRLEHYATKAGIAHIHPHQLRHTFAISFLVRSGGDLVTLARQMGHSSTRTTERYLAVAETKAQKTLAQQHSMIDSLAKGRVSRKAVRRRLSE